MEGKAARLRYYPRTRIAIALPPLFVPAVLVWRDWRRITFVVEAGASNPSTGSSFSKPPNTYCSGERSTRGPDEPIHKARGRGESLARFKLEVGTPKVHLSVRRLNQQDTSTGLALHAPPVNNADPNSNKANCYERDTSGASFAAKWDLVTAKG